MFSSPCSLFSPRCAALIALAAMAGLSRTEPESEDAALHRSTAGESAAINAAAFSARLQQATAWFEFAAAISILSAVVARDDRTVPVHVMEENTPAIPGTLIEPALSPDTHSYPYAVGPPCRGNETTLRAAGIRLPGDWFTLRTPPLRIGRSFFFSFPARFAEANFRRRP